VPHNKQLQRTVTRRRGRGASASFHYALAPRFTRQRAAAELRRYASQARRLLLKWSAMKITVARMRTSCILGVLATALLGTGCASTASQTQPQAEREHYLTYDKVHPRVRAAINMQSDQEILACRSLVVTTFNSPRAIERDGRLDEIVVEDWPVTYYDNSSGREMAQCGFWYCSRMSRENPGYCATHCPPAEWACR